MFFRAYFWSILFAAVLGSSSTFAGVLSVREGTNVPYHIRADSLRYDDSTKTYKARGHVTITKGTSGILVISEDEASRKEPKNCIRCGECVFVCPMGLEPHLLMNLTEKGLYERAGSEDIMTCIECGSCSYVCPSHRPLLDYIRFGKSIVKKLETSRN